MSRIRRTLRAYMWVYMLEMYEHVMPRAFLASATIQKNSFDFRMYVLLLKKYQKLVTQIHGGNRALVERFQEIRIKKIIAIAGTTVWWQKYFAGVVCPLGLESIQPITRPIVADVPKEDLLTLPKDDPSILWRRSGGSSTGTPLVWGLNKTILTLGIAASMFKELEVQGFSFEKNAYKNFCLHLNMFISADLHSFKWFALKDFSLRSTEADFETKVLHLYAILKDTKDILVITSPSELPFLVDTFKERGLHPTIPFFMTVGALLTDEVRSLAEDFFHAKIVSWYGAQEIGPSAIECQDHKNFYHVLTDRVVVEILDEAGEPVERGNKGAITVTCLDNTVMPLLRYQPGDVGVLHETISCVCANTSPLLEILQRNSDVIHFKNGGSRSASPILKYFRRDPFVQLVRKFQVRQEHLDEIRILLEIRDTVPQDAIDLLKHHVSSAYGQTLKISVEQVSLIEQDAPKFKVFVPLKRPEITAT